MGHFAYKGGVDISTGCLSFIDSQAACDCAYRALRSDGYPASQLAAVGSGVTIQNNLPQHAPPWLLRAMTVCELKQTLSPHHDGGGLVIAARRAERAVRRGRGG